MLDKISVFDAELISGYKLKEYKIKMIDIIKELQNSKKALKDCLGNIPGQVNKDEKKFIVQ